MIELSVTLIFKLKQNVDKNTLFVCLNMFNYGSSEKHNSTMRLENELHALELAQHKNDNFINGICSSSAVC